MDSEKSNPPNSSDNNVVASTSNNENMGTDNVNKEIEENFETKKYVSTNKELYKIIEAINEKNENNIEKISNAFLKAIEDIKLGKDNSFPPNFN
ncbi:hypothetical protein PIROE2DRAFT_7133 [Piromyces sp. E2]|nr:hypothetical protein PIROE2DRAFT_7133 [Piromyces sp. E2]|eukprot:OUM65805.1 hypothetical protein PIROE2DRAFT_7133 [Piromyces sp. E2]